ncbi:MAG: SDR family oxidoreductase [Acidimicrobiia bacterium]|nr:SDR family oxidoreductase [Acidimicrobiia bacterium]
MNQRFAEQVVVVTGGGRGIGLAAARAFEAEGARVVVADLARGEECGEFVEADVSDARTVGALFARVKEGYGRLDVLVANAGIPYQSTSLDAGEEEWARCLDVNLKSVWLCAKAAHEMLAGGGHGSIVTVASAQGLRSNKASFPYSAAKGGVLALTRTLAVEYAPAVRVNSVIPGQIESVRTAPYFESFSDPGEARRRVFRSFPMGRLGRPEDIAKAILFLASADAEWITGTFLTVDGGRDATLVDLSDLKEPR